MADDALQAELKICFDSAACILGISTSNADLLQCIAADVADCSAREVITFLLPALDRYAGGGPSFRPWTCVDSALLRALLIALRHVRVKRQRVMLSDCLQALLLQISLVLQSSRVSESTRGDAGCSGDSQSAGSAFEVGSDPLVREVSSEEQGPEYAELSEDVVAFVRGACAALGGDSPATPSEGGANGFHPAAELLAAFVLSVLSSAILATAASDSSPPGAQVTSEVTFIEQQQIGATDPFLHLYGFLSTRTLAVALLGCLSDLGLGSTQRMVQLQERLFVAGDGLEMEDSAAVVQLGLVAVVHAAWVVKPPHFVVELPATPEERLAELLPAMKVLLVLASEYRSIRLSLAALQMLSTAGQQQRSVSGQLASVAVLPALLPASQDLVMTMVQHPAPQVRAAACRGLQHLINSLDPGAQLEVIHELLGCPYPSVAAILLQQLKQLIADTWEPAPGAVALAAEWLQDSGDPNSLVKSAEPICSALNIFRFMLLREPGSKMAAKEIALHHVLERTSNILKGCRTVLDTRDSDDSDVNTTRALERVCEVAERILELAS